MQTLTWTYGNKYTGTSDIYFVKAKKCQNSKNKELQGLIKSGLCKAKNVISNTTR